MTDLKEVAQAKVQEVSGELIELSHDIHAHPELNYQETYSAERVAVALEAAGLKVERGVAELPTAFRATAGTGELNIGICAEYDALPGVGHACGHNIIASAAVGAAAALAPMVDELGITLTVLGTPAEEGGGGKVLMLQRGAFDGLNASLMVHAGAMERDALASLSTSQLLIEFFGKAAHAAAAPHRGRSASAALALSQSGIAMLREHFEPGDRVHGIVTNGGGAPNVVPPHTTGQWFVRGSTIARTRALEARVVDIFRGAALMTGCKMKLTKTSPSFSDIITHPGMAELWRNNAGAVGRESLPIQPTDGLASTDMGNVSYAMPSIHPLIALDSDGANIHEPAFAEFAAGRTGDKAVVDGAQMLALTVIDMARSALRDELLAKKYAVAEVEPDAAHLDASWDSEVLFDPDNY